MPRSRTAILAAGDLIALLLFIIIGQADHSTLNQSNPILGALPNLLALAVPWAIVAFLLQAYPRRPMSLAQFMGRSALAWVIAAPLGLWLRSILQARGGVPIPFLVVTLLVGGLLLLGWRLVFWLVTKGQRSQPKPSTEDKLLEAVTDIRDTVHEIVNK